MAAPTNTDERMSQGFAVFNLHLNDAGERADAEFKRQFGEDLFAEHIQPFHEAGIMSLFEAEATPQTMAWVTLVTAYVNEHVEDEQGSTPSDRLLLDPEAQDAATYEMTRHAHGEPKTVAFTTGGVNGKSADDTAVGNLLDYTERNEGIWTLTRTGDNSELLCAAQGGVGRSIR